MAGMVPELGKFKKKKSTYSCVLPDSVPEKEKKEKENSSRLPEQIKALSKILGIEEWNQEKKINTRLNNELQEPVRKNAPP